MSNDSDRLREAAALMRERAEAAAIMAPPPWWSQGVWYHHFPVIDGEPGEMEAHPWPAVGYGNTGADVVGHNVRRELSDHIASWHPAVALAVADWLEAVASEHEVGDSGNATIDAFFAEFNTADDIAAIAVADVYLRATA